MPTLDWNQLKTEYVLSEEISVMRFLQGSIRSLPTLKRSGFIVKKTNGWRAEKQALRAKTAQEVLNRVIEQRTLRMTYALATAYDVLAEHALDKNYLRSLSVKDLQLCINMLESANQTLGTKVVKDTSPERVRDKADQAAFDKLMSMPITEEANERIMRTHGNYDKETSYHN